MNQYSAYRESDIDWIEQIPDHWHVVPIKRVAKLKSGHTPSRQHPEYWIDCTIPWFTLADVWQLRDGRRRFVDETSEKISELGLANSSARLLPAGTVILSRTASVGFSGIMARPMATTQDFANWICGPPILPEYLLYVLRTMTPELRRLTMGSTHKTIYMPDLEGFVTPLPPIEEQEAIVAFLNRKTSGIDELIDKKQALIERLTEYRTAIIDRAVTKGLDPSVPMKDSEIEWLGVVPEHWRIGRLRNVVSLIQTGPFGSQLHADDYIENGVPVVNPSNLVQGVVVPDWNKTVSAEMHATLERHQLELGDIVFARRGEMGRCALVTSESVGWLCGTGSIKMKLDREAALPDYFGVLLSTAGVRSWLELKSVGSTMSNLNTEILSNIPVPVPSVDEQVEIVEFIRRKSGQITATIHDEERMIFLLQELRASLISEAVTGKIDVRSDVPTEDLVPA